MLARLFENTTLTERVLWGVGLFAASCGGGDDSDQSGELLRG